MKISIYVINTDTFCNQNIMFTAICTVNMEKLVVIYFKLYPYSYNQVKWIPF